MPDGEESHPAPYSVSVRLRRVRVDDAFVSVPVTDAVLVEHEGGASRLDGQKVFDEAIRLGGGPGVGWMPEAEPTIEVHPIQGPAPSA